MNENPVILPVDFIPTIEEFLGALGIKSARLAAQLFTNVFEQVFVSSVDLKAEYEKYYCVEYPALDNYLELAHEIYLEPEELEKKYILKVKSLSGVVDQGYEDNLLQVVIDCIRKLEAKHEG